MPVPPVAPDAASIAAARGARTLTRGVSATWWYTLSAVVFFEFFLLLLWIGTLSGTGLGDPELATVVAGGLVWLASSGWLLTRYRHHVDEAAALSLGTVLPLGVAAAYGLAAGLASGLWSIALFPLAQSLMLLGWPRGIRLRVMTAVTLVLAAAWFVDSRGGFSAVGTAGEEVNWVLVGVYTTLVPPMTVMSLWWWDVLIALDRARLSEARLAATQERLRVATDVHDLQGHHLQVIALQLELAERLMPSDPDAAVQQLRAARASVADAQQGTRDLATRFRTAALDEEIANAADLLRAAGASVEVSIGRSVESAPADVFAPVIRETTTNALRHGGGGWARLSLARDGAQWRYEITNDAAAAADSATTGSGLDGLARRAADAGGRLEVQRTDDRFRLALTVPVDKAGAR
ncbi:sensor histidine kinase [Microbacterium sp. Sa4CUA7]|uniref:histidine kinase n=1 Tax=Microbacterium pullorum TaxID=2762236 RepID=A0ABR8S2V5_9MICO|nr:histidine kinase [Microbacterium pullorum]MBD7957816.1 sensor histidine kinase [Microbacterium pullorum]